MGRTGVGQAREAVAGSGKYFFSCIAVQETGEVTECILVQQCLSTILEVKAAEGVVPLIVKVKIILFLSCIL